MTTTHTETRTQATTIGTTRSKTLTAAFMAAFLGVFMIWGVGFAETPAIHNAAHDVRHSNGFPCH